MPTRVSSVSLSALLAIFLPAPVFLAALSRHLPVALDSCPILPDFASHFFLGLYMYLFVRCESLFQSLVTPRLTIIFLVLTSASIVLPLMSLSLCDLPSSFLSASISVACSHSCHSPFSLRFAVLTAYELARLPHTPITDDSLVSLPYKGTAQPKPCDRFIGYPRVTVNKVFYASYTLYRAYRMCVTKFAVRKMGR